VNAESEGKNVEKNTDSSTDVPSPPAEVLSPPAGLGLHRVESSIEKATEIQNTAGLEPLNAPDFTAIHQQDMIRHLGGLPWRRFDTIFSTVGAHEQVTQMYP